MWMAVEFDSGGWKEGPTGGFQRGARMGLTCKRYPKSDVCEPFDQV